MNWKTWLPLAVAIVLGLVAAQVGRTMLRRGGSSAAKDKLVQVVTVKQTVPAGEELRADDLTLMAVAGDHVPDGMIGEAGVADLTGRSTKAPLMKGQPVLEMLLGPKGAGGLQSLVPEGMRAITIEVNEFSGVAGLLTPGSRVDMVATLQGGGVQELVSRTIVQNIRVTAVGQRTGPARGDEEPGQMFRSVTLLVSPRQAEAIELACATGRPRLVLRGNGDGTATPTPGATLSDLRNQGRPAAIEVAKAPIWSPATQPALAASKPMDQRCVQVLRGGVESQVTFQVPKPAVPVITGTSLEPVREGR